MTSILSPPSREYNGNLSISSLPENSKAKDGKKKKSFGCKYVCYGGNFKGLGADIISQLNIERQRIQYHYASLLLNMK